MNAQNGRGNPARDAGWWKKWAKERARLAPRCPLHQHAERIRQAREAEAVFTFNPNK